MNGNSAEEKNQEEYVEDIEKFKALSINFNCEGGEDVLAYLETKSNEIYSSELERENSLLQQASNMQAAFSFVTAGVFIVAETVADNMKELFSSLPYYLVYLVFFVITSLLVASLYYATCAQRRIIKDQGHPSIEQMTDTVNANKDAIKEIKARQILSIRMNNGFYLSLLKSNEERISWIKKSTGLFYAALATCGISALLLFLVDLLR